MHVPDDLPMRALTSEQQQAVSRRKGSLLLAAGAGSGKTSVLVERFVQSVREDGVAPGQILAITFTERAAGELRARIRARFLEFDERDAARDAEAAHVSTFHGFCARLLRTNPLQASIEPGFQILEEGLADRMREFAFSDALADFLADKRSEAVDLVAAYGADPLRSMIAGAYAQLRSQGQAEPRLPTVAVTDAQQSASAIRASELIGELLERFGEAYMRRKRDRAGLDFDDLELMAGRLLRESDVVRRAWAERFQLLMVDEFQDSNPRQLQVLAALDRDNLFTVGDELQSIYGFRHASVSLFRERHAHLDARGASLALTCNFRSRPPILTAVERIFAERIGESFTPLTPMLLASPSDAPPSGVPVAGGAVAHGRQGRSEEPIVELLLTDKRGWERCPGDTDLDGLPEATPWRQAEARLLAARIAELISSGETYAGEVVVLMRALGDMPVYESALRHQGLHTLAGVGGFWSRQQVGDLLSWLRALANPLDELALYSTLASPLVGVSSDGLALIARAARGHGVWRSLRSGGRPDEELDSADNPSDREGVGDAREIHGLLSAADRRRVSAFRELFAAELTGLALHPIAELLRRVIAATGYDAHVLSLNWGERRLANVQKLVGLARAFEADEGRDLRGFLDHVAHIESTLGRREADAPVGDGSVEAVRLMSIHAAKGLEFPVVCIADLGREPNLRVPDLLVDGAGERLGLRLLQLGDSESEAALDYDELRDEHRMAQQEEEDRVLYVACTRTENRLLLSGSIAFERWPSPKVGVAPIAWLAPALVPDMPKLVASEQRPVGALSVDVGSDLQVRCLINASDTAEETPTRTPQRVESASPAAPEPGVQLSLEMEGMSEPPTDPGIQSTVPQRRWIPTPFADPDSTMSYTSLAELERCGYRFYLERVLRLPENHAAAGKGRYDDGIEARTRGRIVHALLESIDFVRPQPPSEADVERVSRRLGASLDAHSREEIVTLIAGALAAEPARRLSVAGHARREHPFAFSLGPAHPEEPLVTGTLDLIVEQTGGGSLIVDYKSDRLSGGEDLEQLVQRDYGFQRLLYALAAIEAGAREVEVAHWFLERPGEWVSARFASDERPRLRERLLARIARARAHGFAVTQSPHRAICLTCPGRGGLCSWGETRTMSERSTTLESQERGSSLNSG